MAERYSPIDGHTRLGQLAARVLDEIDQFISEHPEGSLSFGEMAIVVEVRGRPDDEHPNGWTMMLYDCTDQRRWVQAGMFADVQRVIERGSDD